MGILHRLIVTFRRLGHRRCYSSTSCEEPPQTNQPQITEIGNVSKKQPMETTGTRKGISKAMKAYLERADNYNKFIQEKNEEFRIGKRHLANMMGYDPENFTQKDIDEAIEYLFPSGLYEHKARPMMKAPEMIFPKQKEAQFDESGRPFHYMFYTLKPQFYDLLHQISAKIKQAYEIEDRTNHSRQQLDPNLKVNIIGYKLIDLPSLEQKLLEKIDEDEYKRLEEAMNRLIALPYAHEFKDFISEWHVPLFQKKYTAEIIKPKTDQNGRQFVTVYECKRKSCTGNVTVYSPGTGKIKINEKDINYFSNVQSREQVLFPLLFTNTFNKVDVEANVEKGGVTSQAGAIRYGISIALQSFVPPEMTQRMQIAGLLQRDYRRRERKKPGQKGARAKFTWNKR